MTDYWENTAPEVIRLLDEFMDTAYFVPLSVGDALAVQLKAPSLKGLPTATIDGILRWMDDLAVPPGQEGEPDPVAVARAFWQGLSEKWPEVYVKWLSEETGLYLDPLGAFQLALKRCEEALADWQAAGPEEISSIELEEARDRGVAEIMTAFDYVTWSDDRIMRQGLLRPALASYPGWARPGIYLDCWAEFVRAVMDLEPGPEIRAVWPY